MQSVQWSRSDEHIRYKIEAVLNGYEVLLTTQQFELDENVKYSIINDMRCNNGYQSINGNTNNINTNFEFVQDNIDEKEDNFDKMINRMAGDDNTHNSLQCKSCHQMSLVPQKSDQRNLLQSVYCGVCNKQHLYYYEQSQTLKTIPISLNINGVLKLISFNEIKYRNYNIQCSTISITKPMVFRAFIIINVIIPNTSNGYANHRSCRYVVSTQNKCDQRCC